MEQSKRRPNLTIDQKEQILSLKKAGKSRTEISLIMNLQYQQVCRYLWSLDPSEIKEVDEYSKIKADYTALRARADKMEQALKQIEQMSDPGDHWLAVVRMKSIASDALEQQPAEPTIPQQELTSKQLSVLNKTTARLFERAPQQGAVTMVYVPCEDDDPRCTGGYTSSDGQSLCHVRESEVPVIESGAVWVSCSERMPVNDHWSDDPMKYILKGKSDGSRGAVDIHHVTYEEIQYVVQAYDYCAWLDEGGEKEVTNG